MGRVVSAGKPTVKKSLLSRIFGSFFFRLLCSFVLAVVVWLTINTTYVNPPKDKDLSISLSHINRSALDNNNMELKTEIFRNTVDIYLKGRQEDLDRITANNFEAYIDFNSIEGIEDTSLAVELRTFNTDNISIVKVEPEAIPIELERRKTLTFDINMQLTGELAEGFYLTNFTRFPATRSFTARESYINQIDRVDVTADISGLSGNTVLHQQCRIYGKDGREINRVGWEQVVDVSLEISKDVPVIANVTGSPAEDHYVRYITTIPEIVRINGTKEALEQVDNLYTETLDIGNSRQNISRDCSLLLPNNVKISMNTLPRALIDVTIFKYQYTQDIALSKGRIELINNLDGYRYEIVESEIPLLLKGKVDDIANLDSSQISAVIDVDGLTPGTHAVQTIVTLPEGIISVNDVLLMVIVAPN